MRSHQSKKEEFSLKQNRIKQLVNQYNPNLILQIKENDLLPVDLQDQVRGALLKQDLAGGLPHPARCQQFPPMSSCSRNRKSEKEEVLSTAQNIGHMLHIC